MLIGLAFMRMVDRWSRVDPKPQGAWRFDRRTGRLAAWAPRPLPHGGGRASTVRAELLATTARRARNRRLLAWRPQRGRASSDSRCPRRCWPAAAARRARHQRAAVPPYLEAGRLFASDGHQQENFGTAVALDGDTLAVGAPKAQVGSTMTRAPCTCTRAPEAAGRSSSS